MRNPGQSGGSTGQSEVESVDIVHTLLLADGPPKMRIRLILCGVESSP
ncbi:hypothetical protein SAMN04487917_10324 [Arthrobacter sp. yr096]|nr:hypothetical protein SAMN04487917_10324 [Arthrobacter sp. yr096]